MTKREQERDAAKKATARQRVLDAINEYGHEFVTDALVEHFDGYATQCYRASDVIGGKWGRRAADAVSALRGALRRIDGRIDQFIGVLEVK